jgi:RHS repeat-associated protein
MHPKTGVVLGIVLATALFSADAVRVSVQTGQPVTLTPTTSPTTGQAGVQPIALTGSNFPSGTITPNGVTVVVSPVTPGSGPSGATLAASVTTVIGSTRRVTFVIPTSLVVAAPTAYLVTFSGMTTTGVAFQTQNASRLVVNPPAALTAVSPATAFIGTSQTITLDTLYTNFVQGSTTASFGGGISVGGGSSGTFGPVTVMSPTRAVAQITVDPAASLGARTVSIQTGVQSASKASAFSVVGPTVTDLEPANLTVAAGGGTGTLTLMILNPDPTHAMHVSVSSGDPTIVIAPAEVVLPAGSSSGTVAVTGASPGGPVVITAALNGTSVTSAVTVRERPAPPVLTEPLVEGVALVGGTSVANALVSVQVNGAMAGSGNSGLDGHFSVGVAALVAGNLVTATQTSGALTSLPSPPVTVRARPPAPSVTAPLVAGSTQVLGTGVAGATADVFVNGTDLGTALVATDGTFTASVPALVAGQQVGAIQSLGGITSIPSAAVTVVDRPAPPSIVVPLIEGGTSVTGGGATGASVEGFVEGTSAGTTTVNGSGTWTLAVSVPLVAGQHVKARQTVGTIPSAFSADVIVVARPPAPIVNTPLVAGSTSIGGGGVAGASVAVLINDVNAGTTSVGSDGTWTLVLAAPLVVGQQVIAAQTVGGVQSPFSPPLTVVARPPAPTVNGPLVDGMTTVTGSGTAGASLDLFIGTSVVGTATVGASGNWTVALGTALVVGEQVTARQTVAGVTSDFSAALTVVVGPPAPTVTAPLVAGETTVSGSAIPGASVQAFANGTALGTTASGGSGTWALPLASALVAGQVVTAQQTLAGIPSALSAPVTVQAAFTRIDITPAPAATLTKGERTQFLARGTLSDGSVQDPLVGVLWSSDNAAVGSITSSGLATGAGAGVANIRAALGSVVSSPTALTVKPLPPLVTAPLSAGMTVVNGIGSEPGASVQVFVNGAAWGLASVADGAGQWSSANLAPALAANDSVTARQTVNGVPSEPSAAVIVGASNQSPQARDHAYAITGRETDIALPSGFQGRILAMGAPFVTISGLAFDPAGQLFVADWGHSNGQLFKLPLFSKTPFTLDSGLPLSDPDQMLLGDGRASIGHDLIVADHNSEETQRCCNGRVFRVNPNTGTISVVAHGAGGFRAGGDPFGVALGPGGAFGTYLYVMDFQGTSPDPPVLYRVDANGTTSLFVSNPSMWSTIQDPMYLAFATGNGFGTDLFVSDPAFDGGTPTIWRVTGDGTLSAFIQGPSIGTPSALRFAPGGTFGNGLYFIDSSFVGGGALKRLLPNGTVETFATNLQLPQEFTYDLVFAPDGHALYFAGGDKIIEIVADSSQTRLNVIAPGLLADATDPDGDHLTSSLVTSPAHGSVSLANDGSFSYFPAVGFSGVDSFTYKANDGSLDSNAAKVAITVVAPQPANEPPYVSAGPDQTITASSSSVLSVSGRANVFAAGGAISPVDGISPPSVSFAARPGQDLTFQSVTGLVSWGGGVFNGPNGETPPSPAAATDGTDLNSQAGISGIRDIGNIMFLVGVFLDDSVPSGAPPSRLDFSGNERFTTLSPVIGQPFFIGDGLTAGTPKVFHVPATATRLFLGFADGSFFHGVPGLYGDNSGAVTATLTITDTARLNGSASDDGLPLNGSLSINWSELSGPGSATFADPHAASTTVAFGAAGVYVLRLSASDSQYTSVSDVTVNAIGPVLTQVLPNTGRQGQQNLSVAISGQFTHWVQGTTTASFGPGITVASLVVSSSTIATASITIDPSATIGARTVTVTTGAEVASLTNSFAVTANTPVITRVNPNTGRQGQQNLSVTITGQFTHWLQGTTNAGFSAGITVVSLAVGSATAATAVINIDPAAPISTGTVTLTTGSEIVTLANGFTVTAPSNAPPVVSAGPNQTIAESFDALVVNYNQGAPAVPGTHPGGVLRYDGATGTFLGAFVPGGAGTHIPWDVHFGPDGNLYVLDFVANAAGTWHAGVLRYDGKIGGLIDQFIPYGTGAVSVQDTSDFAFGPDGNLYLSSYDANPLEVRKYDGQTGAFLGIFASNPSVPIAGGGDSTLAFGPDGNLYVAYGNNVYKFDGTTGTFIGVFISGYGSGSTASFVFRDGYVYLNDTLFEEIRRFNASTGAFVDSFVKNSATIPFADFMGFAPDGSLWAGEGNSANAGNIQRFDGTTGAFIDVIIPIHDGELAVTPTGFTFLDTTHTTLSGAASDSGLPPGGALSVSWSQISGPGRASFVSPVSVQTEVDFSAPGSYVLRLTATDSNGTSSSDVTVTVLPAGSAASLASVRPGSALQGQTVTVTLGGQKTHWSAGTTQVDLGPGVTVTAVTVSSATSLTAQLTLDVAAVIGPRAVTVTTGGEVVSLAYAFQVLSASTPLLLSVTPNTAEQGKVPVSVSITGQNTHFMQGLTQVALGAGVSVGSIAVSSPTALNAQLTIAAGAALGYRTLVVTTNGEAVSLPRAFVITVPTTSPALTLVAPPSGQQAQSGPVTIVGANTHFVQGSTQVDLGAGVTVNSVSVSCSTCLTVQVSIPETTATGPRTVTVTTGGEVVSLANGFTVQPGTPILTSLSQASGRQGQSFAVTITGKFTHFVQSATQVSFGAGVTVSNVVVSSPTALSAQLTIDPAATLGTRTLMVTSGTEVVSVNNVFTIAASASLTRIDITPAGTVTLTKGQTFQFSARGTFADGSVQDPLAGVTWSSDTTSVASVTAAGLATGVAAGIAHVSATKSGVQSAATTFVVKPLPVGLFGPISAGATVVTGAAAEPGGAVQVFVNGLPRGAAAVADGGGQWTVSSLAPTLATGDSVTARQTVNGVQSDSSATIIVTAGSPTIVSINPATGTQGQQNLNVAITGQFTHFAQGVSQVFFASSTVTVNSVTVSSSTSLTANISIALNASLVPRTVTVTTGAEVAALANAFTVQAATNQAPVVTIAPSWSDTLPSRLTLAYTVTDDGLPLGGGLTISWSAVSGPGTVGFQNQTPTSISVGFDQAGTYVLSISATDTQLTTSQNVTVTVTGTPLQAPTVSIATPTEGTEVTGPINVVGTATSASLASWTLEFKMSDESSFRTLASGTAPVANGVLGQFDPTLLLNGLVLIRLRATDTFGTSSTTDPVTVVLTKNQKVGNFTVSFKDLDVPLPGLSIQLIRTYDSRNPLVGDFGTGWTLDIRNVRLRDNGAIGLNWQGTVTGSAFDLNLTYCIQATRKHVITVILSDGTVYTFQPVITPQCQQFVPILEATIAFTQLSGPSATLALAGGNTVATQSAWPGPVELLDESTLQPVDFDHYRLTLPDGRTLNVSRAFGLETLTDLNANTLTITPSGIVHSSGKSVSFQRDAQGRITTVTDPAGRTLTYAYDQSGNLASFTDQLGNVSTYTYDANHRLLTIHDPRGVQPIRNDYDASGRLIGTVDAFGNAITYTQDFANRKETVTDRLGNATINEYDSDGNVVRVTDALQGVTQRSYDGHGNVLSETNALGKTRAYTYDANDNRLTETDPLGNTTRYTYTSLNRVATITDALGRVTTNAYDANGNLTATTDALGKTTTYAYNTSGLRTSVTDPLGNATQYQYDRAGNLSQQTDALGHITSYTSDASGNRLTETKTQTTGTGTRTLVTQYQYDAQNRLTKTTFADGGTTQTSYNNIGKPATTIDQLGHQTTYVYDLMGRLTQTTFPDGTTESSTYDAEGDRTGSVDRAGRLTSYAYDGLKRLTQTTFPDSATTATTYDAAGEVTAVADARGDVTQYAYDAAGRRTLVTDPLGHTTSFAYDAVGNQLSMRDANGNVTQYQYDNDNRRVKTVYADGTSDSVAYDPLGRTVSKTDQAGLTTQFQYDKLGRLAAVIDALSQPTSYTYDELGNRTSQTDANGHVTRFAYDAVGRRLQRTLPLGMSETSSYDAAGNLASKTDFNVKTTAYAYDAVNRLRSKTPDAAFGASVVQFSYSATGQRLQMVDASGTTTYAYDTRDRLLSKATPQGTLTYTYDPGGNLTAIQSSNTGGTSVTYAYDALNRLATVTDNRLSPGVTTYTYDNAGNLANFKYPNGVQHGYTYNPLNRLTTLAVMNTTTSSTLASYSYTLGPTGNRTAVAELSGRRVDYTYDSLYRLTVETITGAVGGTTTYAYDPVGNRLSRSSPTTGLTFYSYDANDRLTTDAYDTDGNTTASGGNVFNYDFENHLTNENTGAVSIVYDGDGNRVAKTVGGVTTHYLVDDRNLTGYAQVLEELSGGAVLRVYTYGLNRISQSQASGTSFFGYDGHGSVRLLTDSTGAVTDRYDYDAFGNIISQAGSTPNVYLYSGEQVDPNLGFYYLRARYMNAATGRFWTMDKFSGHANSPITIHKYVYVGNEPVLRLDPNGNDFDIASLSVEIAVASILLTNPSVGFGQSLPSQGVNGVSTLLPASGEGYYRYYDADTGDRYYYGRLSTIQTIESIASEWYAFSADSDVGPTRIGIGDISKQGGGSLAGGQPSGHNHPNGHTLGLEVDIRPLRQDGAEQNTNVHWPSYSFVRNFELASIILKYNVRIILFGDHIPGVRFDGSGAHDDHLHVAFY